MLATVGSDPVQLVVMHDGSRLYLDARERTEGGPFWNGSYSPDELSILQASFDANLTFVDVGANVGLISIPMIRFIEDRGAGGRVVAVEPVPANVARLKRSLALTPSLRARVTAVETALRGVGRHNRDDNGTARADIECDGECAVDDQVCAP